MVSKSLIYKLEYRNLESEDSIPNISVKQIGKLLEEKNMIWPFINYDITRFPVNFRNLIDGTRKDIVFHYFDKNPILGEPFINQNGAGIPKLIGMEDSDREIKVNIVSFFTKITNNASEHRIYQIGRRYAGKDTNFGD